MLERVWRKGKPLLCWWDCKLIQPLRRTVYRFLKKLKRDLKCDPAIPLLGNYPKKTIFQKDTCTPVFTAGHGDNLDVHPQKEHVQVTQSGPILCDP